MRTKKIKASLLFVMLLGITCRVGADTHTLIASGDWTLTDSIGGQTTADVATWDSAIFTDQTLETANIALNISTLRFTTDTKLGAELSSEGFAKATLSFTGPDGYSGVTEFTSPNFMQSGSATDNGDGTFTYLFGATLIGSIPVYKNQVGFLVTEGPGQWTYNVLFMLYDTQQMPVTDGYTVTGTGAVDVSYVYSGTPVPEPATATLALLGIGLLFPHRRRT